MNQRETDEHRASELKHYLLTYQKTHQTTFVVVSHDPIFDDQASSIIQIKSGRLKTND